MSDPEKLVDPADFLSIKLGVSFKNLVSGTEVDIKSAGLDEIGDSSVVLSLPANSCAIDHNVMFHVYQSGAGAPQVPLIFVATGKVSQIEDAPDSRSRVQITLVQYDEQSWQALLKIFSSRQDEISDFLASVTE